MKVLMESRLVGRILAAHLPSSGLRGGWQPQLLGALGRPQLWSMLLRRRLRLRRGDVARGTHHLLRLRFQLGICRCVFGLDWLPSLLWVVWRLFGRCGLLPPCFLSMSCLLSCSYRLGRIYRSPWWLCDVDLGYRCSTDLQ